MQYTKQFVLALFLSSTKAVRINQAKPRVLAQEVGDSLEQLNEGNNTNATSENYRISDYFKDYRSVGDKDVDELKNKDIGTKDADYYINKYAGKYLDTDTKYDRDLPKFGDYEDVDVKAGVGADVKYEIPTFDEFMAITKKTGNKEVKPPADEKKIPYTPQPAIYQKKEDKYEEESYEEPEPKKETKPEAKPEPRTKYFSKPEEEEEEYEEPAQKRTTYVEKEHEPVKVSRREKRAKLPARRTPSKKAEEEEEEEYEPRKRYVSPTKKAYEEEEECEPCKPSKPVYKTQCFDSCLNAGDRTELSDVVTSNDGLYNNDGQAVITSEHSAAQSSQGQQVYAKPDLYKLSEGVRNSWNKEKKDTDEDYYGTRTKTFEICGSVSIDERIKGGINKKLNTCESETGKCDSEELTQIGDNSAHASKVCACSTGPKECKKCLEDIPEAYDIGAKKQK